MDPRGFQHWRRPRQLNVLATTGACAPCRAPVAGPAACTDLSASQPRSGAQPASRSARSSRSRSFPGRGRSRDRLRRQFPSRPLEKHLARPGQPVALPPYCACVSSRIGTHHNPDPATGTLTQGAHHGRHHHYPHPAHHLRRLRHPSPLRRLLLRRRSRPALHRHLHHPNAQKTSRTSSRPSDRAAPAFHCESFVK